MKLRKAEFCPIHESYFCCGRQMPRRYHRGLTARQNARIPKQPIERIDDPHHPRGYRELRNKTEMRKLLLKKLKEQGGLCGICGKPISDFREAAPDHIEPRGMGGGRRDDHSDNIQATHSLCNNAKGSKRNYVVTGREK